MAGKRMLVIMGIQKDFNDTRSLEKKWEWRKKKKGWLIWVMASFASLSLKTKREGEEREKSNGVMFMNKMMPLETEKDMKSMSLSLYLTFPVPVLIVMTGAKKTKKQEEYGVSLEKCKWHSVLVL